MGLGISFQPCGHCQGSTQDRSTIEETQRILFDLSHCTHTNRIRPHLSQQRQCKRTERQVSNRTLIAGSPADSPEWTALTVQSQSSQMIGSTVMLAAATAASTTMPVYGNASLPRMLVKKSFRPIVIAICQFFCPPSKPFSASPRSLR